MAYVDNGINNSIKVFLRAFGLILKESNDEESYICDRVNGKEDKVGSFHINSLSNGDNRYSTSGYLHAEIGGGKLTAQIKANRINNGGSLAGINTINFNFSKNNGKSSKGEMTIKRFPNGHCLYEIEMEYSNSEVGKKVELALNHKRMLFSAKVKEKKNIERIRMNFSKPSGNSIIHETGAFACSDKVEECPLYKSTAIKGLGRDGRLVKIWKTRQERFGGEDRRKRESVIAKEQPNLANVTEREALNRQMLFAGTFLCEVDTTIGNIIQRLINETFVVNGVPVIRNFFSICYMDYGVRPIHALFGIVVDTSFRQFEYERSNEYPSSSVNDRRARK